MHFGGFPNLIIDFTNIYNCIDHAIILFDTFLWFFFIYVFHHIGIHLFVCSNQIYAMNILRLSVFRCLSISIKNELKTEKINLSKHSYMILNDHCISLIVVVFFSVLLLCRFSTNYNSK